MLSLLNPSRRECDLSDRIAQIPLRFEIRCRVMSTDAARFLPSICRQILSAYSVTFSSEFYQSSDITNSNASNLTADKICNLAVLDRLCLTTACRIYRFSMKISIHPLTADPTAAWHELSQHQKVVKITAKVPTTEAPSDKLRVVCMSDTHSLTPYIKFDIPMGDVFIHAGDFTKCGSLQEVIEFNNWIGNLPHKHKIIIAGNHELSFDPTFTNPFSVHTSGDHQKHTGTSILDNIPTLGMSKDALAEAIKTTNIKDYLTNCTYLEDSEITVHGIKIYGTPWQPEFCKWAFNVPRGEACLSKWEMIPSDTDILVTHTPPVGHGDLCCTGVRAGCVELLSTVQNRVKPKYHVFGHIHEGYGISSDGKIIYINASTCDLNYLPNNPPIVFDITLPSGIQKS